MLSGVSALAVSFAGSALAADPVTVEPIVVAQPVAGPPSDYWSGPYVGGSVGYAWNYFSTSDLCSPLDPRDIDSSPVTSPLAIGFSSDNVGTNPYGLPTTLGGVTPAYSCRPFELIANGGGPGNSNDDVLNVYSDVTDRLKGGLVFGGFVGNNWQNGSTVFGVELEGTMLQGTDSTREFNFAYFENSGGFLRSVGSGIFTTEGPDWIATGSARIGGLVNGDQTLVYVRGGFSVGDTMMSTFEGEAIGGGLFFDSGSDCDECAGLDSAILTGTEPVESGYGFGGTVGAGIEHMFNERFGIGVEYQYTKLHYVGGHEVDLTIDRTVTSGIGDVRTVKFTNLFGDFVSHAVKLRATIYLK